MISLNKIKIENFMCIPQLEMEFPKNNSIVMIGGENGSGKSTLFLAIAVALTGYRKSDSYKEYVMTGCEEASVYLDAEYNGAPIIFETHIINKEYGAPLKRIIHYQNQTYSNKDCATFIKDHELDDLEQIMFFFQNDNSIINLKPTERARLLKKLFRFDFEDKVDQLKIEQEQLKETSIKSQTLLNSYKEREFPFARLLTESSEEDIKKHEEEYEKLKKELEEYQEIDFDKIDSVNKNIKDLKLKKANTISELSRASNSLSQYNAKLNLLKNDPVTSLDEKDLKDQINTLSKKLSDTTSEKDSKDSYLQNLRRSQAILQDQYHTLQDQYRISQTGVCHSCGQSISQEYIESLEKKVKEKELEVKKSSEEVSKAQKDFNSLKSSINDLNYSLTELQHKLDRHVSNIQSIGSLTTTVSSLENQKVLSQQMLDTIEASLKNALNELKENENILSKVKDKEELEQRCNFLKKSIQTEKQAQVINQERRNQNERTKLQKAENDTQIELLTKQVNKNTLQASVLRESIQILQDDFPNFIILKACEKLEKYINEFIQRVFPYMKVKLQQKNYGVEFYYTSFKSEDNWLNVKMASGAQSSILGLAYKIALARMYGIRTLLMDEIDASATEENSVIEYQFIANLDAFDQILLISHKKSAFHEMAQTEADVIGYWVENGEYERVSNLEDF